MAEGKKSFVLYADLLDNIEHLTNEEKGILFNHLLEYVNDKNPILEDRIIVTAWKPIEKQLKRDLKKFEEVKTKRSEAGKRSAELRALKGNEQTSTNPTSVESVEQTSTNPTDNDKCNMIYDNDNDKCNINNNNLNNIDTNVSFPEKFIELYNLYSGSKKDLETEYKNWIEKCEWNVDYDFLISKLKKTDKQHFQSWLNKFRTEPSKFRKIIIEEYLKFHEEKTSFKLSLKAYQINSCENISKYIESAVKLKSNSLGKVIDNIEQDVRDSIVFIFSNWNLLNDFYRSQISIEQIDKNFSNIIQQIKQGYAKQQQSESDPKIGRTRLSSLEKLRQQMLNQ